MKKKQIGKIKKVKTIHKVVKSKNHPIGNLGVSQGTKTVKGQKPGNYPNPYA